MYCALFWYGHLYILCFIWVKSLCIVPCFGTVIYVICFGLVDKANDANNVNKTYKANNANKANMATKANKANTLGIFTCYRQASGSETLVLSSTWTEHDRVCRHTSLQKGALFW